MSSLHKFWSDPDGAVILVRRVFSEAFKQHLGVYGFALSCMAVVAATTASSAWLMRYVVDYIFVTQNPGMVGILSLTIIGISITKGFATYGQTIALGRIGNAITATYQRRIIDKFLAFGLDFFSRRHSSKLIMRMSHNARAAQDVVTLVSTSLGRDLLTVIALVGVMIAADPLMSLVALLVAPLLIFGVSKIGMKIKVLASEEFQALAAVIALTQETIQGIRIVKSFTLEQSVRENVNEAVLGAERRANTIKKIQAAVSPLTETLGGVSIGLVILYASWQTTSAGTTPGEFVAFLTAFLLASEPAKRLAKLNIRLERSLNGVRLMYRILDRPDSEAEDPMATKLERVAGHVAIQNVNFGYRRGKPILHDVSIEVEPGSVVALVGPSGSGKTTIISLIQRFYNPWSGTVMIDGVDIKKVSLKSLRQNVSLVSQDTFLFSGTVYENIALGQPGAKEAEIKAAADAANATDFILDLEGGFDAELGENGVTLSSGQRQRIAIARAVLKAAPILLLDEATSALDTESEKQVHSAIKRLMKGRTTIVVAHRLSTIALADRTYVIDDGRIIEAGTHDTLLSDKRLYSRLFGSDDRGPEQVERPPKHWQVVQ